MAIDDFKLRHINRILTKAFQKYPHRFMDDEFRGEPFSVGRITVTQLGTLFLFSGSRGQNFGTIQVRKEDDTFMGFVYEAPRHTIDVLKGAVATDSSLMLILDMMVALDGLFESLDKDGE